MVKLANQVLDVYDDISHLHLKKIASKNPQVYVMTPDERAGLHDYDFALSVITKKASKLNKFPINDFNNTWLSNEFFEETHQRLPKIAAETAAYNIKKACEKFNVKPTPAVVGLAKEASSNIYVEGDMSPVAPRTKSADMTKLADVQQIGDNYTMAQYAMASKDHVKLACQYFDKHHEKMPVEYRHKYAAAIQKRAGELGMGAQQGTVAKYASDIYSAHLEGHLSSRRSLLEAAEPKFSEALTKLAAMKKELPPSDFAKLLYGFDKRANLDKYYGSYLTNPFEATFGNQINPNAKHSYKIASGDMTLDAIQKVSTEKYAKIKEYFGQSIADELKKHGADIFEALPMDAKEIIAGIADGTL